MDPVQIDTQIPDALKILLRPQTYKQVQRDGLNNMAFEYRKQGPGVLAKHDIIRNRAFVQSRFQVQKAAGASLEAHAGSVPTPRFSGWEENYGTEPERTRSMMLAARGGTKEAQVKKGMRMRAGVDYPDPAQFADLDSATRSVAMISMIARHPSIAASSGGLFILLGGGFKAGLYKLASGASKLRRTKKGMAEVRKQSNAETYEPDVEMVQAFKKPPKSKRVDWNSEVVQKTLSQAERAWILAFGRLNK